MQKPNAFQFPFCFPYGAKTKIRGLKCTFSATHQQNPDKNGSGICWKRADFGSGLVGVARPVCEA